MGLYWWSGIDPTACSSSSLDPRYLYSSPYADLALRGSVLSWVGSTLAEPGLQLVFLQGCRFYLVFFWKLFSWLQVRWLFWNHPETSAVLSALQRSVFFPCRVLCIGMQIDCDFHNLLPLVSWVGRDEPDLCCSFPLPGKPMKARRKHQTEQVGNVCLHCVRVHMALEALISHMS